MKKSEFFKLWTREAANVPGIPVETVALQREPILRKPAISLHKQKLRGTA